LKVREKLEDILSMVSGYLVQIIFSAWR